MLWRESYSPVIRRNLTCPATQSVALDGLVSKSSCEVWIGGFGFLAAADQGVWWRLFQSDFRNDGRVKRVYILESADPGEVQTALSLIPRSEVHRCLLVEDPNHFWSDLIEPDNPARGFTAIIENGSIPLLVVGPPTEEVWEEFSREWQLRT